LKIKKNRLGRLIKYQIPVLRDISEGEKRNMYHQEKRSNRREREKRGVKEIKGKIDGYIEHERKGLSKIVSGDS